MGHGGMGRHENDRGRTRLLTGGSLYNFDERWNPQKLEETLLLLLLGREVQKTKFI
jgi:hypothetical protein